MCPGNRLHCSLRSFLRLFPNSLLKLVPLLGLGSRAALLLLGGGGALKQIVGYIIKEEYVLELFGMS